MTVAEFKKKERRISSVSFFHKDNWYADEGQFDNYIITEIYFETDWDGNINCILDIVEPQE